MFRFITPQLQQDVEAEKHALKLLLNPQYIQIRAEDVCFLFLLRMGLSSLS